MKIIVTNLGSKSTTKNNNRVRARGGRGLKNDLRPNKNKIAKKAFVTKDQKKRNS